MTGSKTRAEKVQDCEKIAKLPAQLKASKKEGPCWFGIGLKVEGLGFRV